MMRIAAFLLLAAAAVASAKTYTVKLLEPAKFGDTQLAPGEYKVDVNEQTAVIHNGKTKGECAVKIENADRKFEQTTVRLNTATGTPKIQEIRLGGTKTKLVFSGESRASESSQ